MNLITQLQGVGYSFVCGLIFTFCYHLTGFYIFKIKYCILRLALQVVAGIVFAGGYYSGLLIINDGILRLYFLMMFVFGYIVYQNFFSEKCYGVIVGIDKSISLLLLPIKIVFCKINGIIKHTKKVIRWRKQESEKRSCQ